METRKSPETEVIRDAERIVFREKWRVCERRAAERLAVTTSLKWTRLFPESAVIQIVAVDGTSAISDTTAPIGSRPGPTSGVRLPIATHSAPLSWRWHAMRSAGDAMIGLTERRNENEVDADSRASGNCDATTVDTRAAP